MVKVKKIEFYLFSLLTLLSLYFALFYHYDALVGNTFYFVFNNLNIFYILYQLIVKVGFFIFSYYTLKILGIITFLLILFFLYKKYKSISYLLFIIVILLLNPYFLHLSITFTPFLLSIFVFFLWDYLSKTIKFFVYILSFFITPYLPLLLLFKIENKRNLFWLIPLLLLYYLYYFINTQIAFLFGFMPLIYSLIIIPVGYFLIKIKHFKKEIIFFFLLLIIFIIFPIKYRYYLPFLLFLLYSPFIFKKDLLKFIFLLIAFINGLLFLLNQDTILNNIYKIDSTQILYKHVKQVPTLTDSTILSKELYITQIKNPNKKILYEKAYELNNFVGFRYIIIGKFVLIHFPDIPSTIKYFYPLFDYKEIAVYKNSAYNFFKQFVDYINSHTYNQVVIVDNSIYPLINSKNKISLNDFLTDYKKTHIMLKTKFLFIPDYMIETAKEHSFLYLIKTRLEIEQWKVVMSKGGYTLYQSPYTK